MKNVQFEGIKQAARILSCVQPYVRNSEDTWIAAIKQCIINEYNRTGKFTDLYTCAGFTLIRGEDLDDIISYEVFVSSIMIDQFVLNDFQAKPYAYDDIHYYQTILV